VCHDANHVWGKFVQQSAYPSDTCPTDFHPPPCPVRGGAPAIDTLPRAALRRPHTLIAATQESADMLGRQQWNAPARSGKPRATEPPAASVPVSCCCVKRYNPCMPVARRSPPQRQARKVQPQSGILTRLSPLLPEPSPSSLRPSHPSPPSFCPCSLVAGRS
jgi:hypothetical protein